MLKMTVAFLLSALTLHFFKKKKAERESIANQRKNRTVSVVFFCLLVVYLVLLFHLTFFCSSLGRTGGRYDIAREEYLASYCNFLPFHTIGNYISATVRHNYRLSLCLLNLGGNLLLLAPVGILLPRCFPVFRRWYCFLAVALLFPVFIEGMQFLFTVGSCDVDDVILNFTGAFIAYLICYKTKLQRLLLFANE